jgi:long-chain acyl-CoA synthetase
LVPRHSTVLDLVEYAFSKYASKPAFTCLGHTMSFAEIDEKSRVFASYLRHELKLQPGDRFAIQSPNLLQFPIALYGAIRAGLVVVNVNPLYTPREIKHQLNDSGASALLVLSNVAHNAAEIIAETQIKHVIVTDLVDEHPALKRMLIHFVVKKIKKLVKPFQFDSALRYRDVMATAAKDFDTPEVNPDSLMVLQYTGGTTGVSKGAMLSHGNLASNVWQMISHMPQAFDEAKEVFVACLPAYHIYALNLHLLAAFSEGSHNLLIPNPRDLASVVKAMQAHKFTVFIGINTLFTALCRFEAFKQLDFSALKITSAGGMALTEDAAKHWRQVTSCDVTEGYGLTETSPVLTGNPCTDIRLGTIGIPLPETDIKILDDQHKEVPDGDVGELAAKGPQVMQGYWQREDATAQVMTSDGYFLTGDMAIKCDDGFFKIVDRKKDMILVSGFNVYPNEIEDVLCQHPGVVEAAAVGVKDEESGEIVKVFVVREQADLCEEDVIQFCRKNLTAYKVPKLVEFKEELPKSNVGKILRRELR